MKLASLFLAALIALGVTATFQPVAAQTAISLTDPSRLSVGIRAYRSFDEKPGVAGSYTSGWWVGLPLAWELTSPKDPNVKLPISLIGAVDIGVPAGGRQATVRGYLGFAALLKRSGQ